MKNILLSQKIHEDAIEFLKNKGFNITISPSPDDETVRENAGEADAIIVRTATKLSRETIFSSPRLKVIARTGGGVDNVDIEAASEKNIPVCNTPEANTDSVAEHALAFMLALSKYLNKMDSEVRSGNFAIRNSYLPVDMAEKTLGLVGFGKIGRKLAKLCYSCFKMNILFFDPYVQEFKEDDFQCKKMESMDKLFELSDFISVHIPYTKENHHIIGEKLLGRMKKSAFIINTSRGGIIDEKALAEALNEEKISGAALDVFENEPPENDNPLLMTDNVYLTPHSAALTKESSRRMAMHAAEGVADFLEGKNPKWVFNRDKIKI
jgi:D-3-phosphoglycerate dehydrogenase